MRERFKDFTTAERERFLLDITEILTQDFPEQKTLTLQLASELNRKVGQRVEDNTAILSLLIPKVQQYEDLRLQPIIVTRLGKIEVPFKVSYNHAVRLVHRAYEINSLGQLRSLTPPDDKHVTEKGNINPLVFMHKTYRRP